MFALTPKIGVFFSFMRKCVCVCVQTNPTHDILIASTFDEIVCDFV